MTAFVFTPRGPFSLASAARFAEEFPGTDAQRPTDALRFAWAVDDDWRTVTATISQPGATVRAQLAGSPSDSLRDAARRDLERIFSLDVDGRGFATLGRRDRVVGMLQRRFPGLRPVLFYTPYESAAWTIIGQRIRMTQAATIKNRIAEEMGVRGAFPSPDRLAAIAGPQRGLTDRKLGQLRALARAAGEGRLSRDRLRGMTYEDAVQDLQSLPGIGPFSAELIVIRGAGDPDAFPDHEPRVQRATREAYGLPDDADLAPTTEAWRPYRAWVGLLLRAWISQPAH